MSAPQNVAAGISDAPPPELSAFRLGVRQTWALVAYTVRESLFRWTLITYVIGISFFLVLLATAVNLDIVEGTLASASLFGQDLQIGELNVQVADLVRYFQVTIITLLYMIGVGLALFLTSNYIPAIARAGWADLLIAQPISRSALLLGRVLGAITVVSFGVAYLVIGSWAVLRLKTGFGSTGFLLAGLIILAAFIASYSATVLAGVITGNAPVSGIIGFFVWVAGHVIYAFHAFPEWQVAFRAGWLRTAASGFAEGLYWSLPKNQGLWEMAVGAARGEAISAAPVFYSLPFAFLCLFLACWWFTKRDY